MRPAAIAFSRVVLTCCWFTTSRNVWGRYLRAITWYMWRLSRWCAGTHARPRGIRGTRAAPLPLLPSGPGGVCGRPLHGARDLTTNHRSTGLRWGRRFGNPCRVVKNRSKTLVPISSGIPHPVAFETGTPGTANSLPIELALQAIDPIKARQMLRGRRSRDFEYLTVRGRPIRLLPGGNCRSRTLAPSASR